MSTITVDVRDFEPTGPIPVVTIKRARVTIATDGTAIVSTAAADTITAGTFDLTAGVIYRLEVTGLSGIRTPLYVTGPATSKTLAALYRQDRIDPITLQPLPAYPTVAAALAGIQQQLTDFIGLDAGEDATVAAALAARPTAVQVAATYLPKWQPSTAYTAGQFALSPTGQIISAKVDFTSATTYSASNWNVISSGGGGTGFLPGTTNTLATAGTLTTGSTNLLNAAAGAFTATLPTPTAAGQLLLVERVDTSTNLISIGGTVRGATTGLPTLPGLGVAGESILFESESTSSWRIVASHKPKGLLDQQFDALGAAAALKPSIAAAAAFTAATSDQVRALATYPLATGLTVTTQTSGGNLGTAVSTITGTVYTPSWTASTYYPAGATVLDPTTPNLALNTIVRTTAGTSGATYDATEQAKWTTRAGGGPTGYPVRYNASRLRSSEGNGVPMFFPRDRHKTDNSENAAYAFRPQQWSIDFDWYTAAGAIEVPVFGQCQTRFIVDGKYNAIAPTIPVPATPNNGDYNWRFIKLSGVAPGYHRMRIEFGGPQPQPGGLKIATADRLFPPTIPPTKSLVLIGDSIAEGSAAVDSSSAPITGDVRGYGLFLGKLLGISNYYSLAVSASGYTLPATQAFVGGIQDMAAIAPDYVLVASTGNDQGNVATLPAAIADFCTQLKAALVSLPNTKVIISGVPIYGSGTTPAETINPIIKSAVEAAGLTYLDTTSWAYNLPAALVSSDNLHPTVAGAEYVARRYAAALGPIWGLPT